MGQVFTLTLKEHEVTCHGEAFTNLFLISILQSSWQVWDSKQFPNNSIDLYRSSHRVSAMAGRMEEDRI